MGHCSRKPGAERRRFFELKRYVRADRRQQSRSACGYQQVKTQPQCNGVFAGPLVDFCQFDILQSALPGGDRMKFGELRRREFITLLGGTATTWLLGTRGHQPAHIATSHYSSKPAGSALNSL